MFPEAPRRRVMPADPRVRQFQARLVGETDCWSVEDHVCRDCLGRILGRPGPDGRVYMCADCGRSHVGASRSGGRIHPTMCACGLRYGTRDAGVRCVENPDRTVNLPQAIIASQVA